MRKDTVKHHPLLISVIHLRVSSVFLVSGARMPVCWCIRTTSPLVRWLSETRGAPDPRPSLPWDRCAARGTVREVHLILNSGPGRVPRMTYMSIIFVCWCHSSCLRFVITRGHAVRFLIMFPIIPRDAFVTFRMFSFRMSLCFWIIISLVLIGLRLKTENFPWCSLLRSPHLCCFPDIIQMPVHNVGTVFT